MSGCDPLGDGSIPSTHPNERHDMPNKMYILIKDNVPADFVPLICAHASLSAYLRNDNDEDMKDWVKNSFKKVVCKVDAFEFELHKCDVRTVVITESALENREVAIVFLPSKETPMFLRFLKLYKV